MTGKFIAYYRVSTGKQKLSGLGLAAQQHAVREYLNGGRWKLLEEVTEVESGKKPGQTAIGACSGPSAGCAGPLWWSRSSTDWRVTFTFSLA